MTCVVHEKRVRRFDGGLLQLAQDSPFGTGLGQVEAVFWCQRPYGSVRQDALQLRQVSLYCREIPQPKLSRTCGRAYQDGA